MTVRSCRRTPRNKSHVHCVPQTVLAALREGYDRFGRDKEGFNRWVMHSRPAIRQASTFMMWHPGATGQVVQQLVFCYVKSALGLSAKPTSQYCGLVQTASREVEEHFASSNTCHALDNACVLVLFFFLLFRQGYDKYGYDKEGFTKDGLNYGGFDKLGYNDAGFNK